MEFDSGKRVSTMEALQSGLIAPKSPAWREVLDWPLPASNLRDRLLLRTLAFAACGRVRAVHGLEHIAPENDPIVLVANHNTRREALLVPGLLVFYRGGRLIRFLADWNFRLIPGIGFIYRRSGAITVTRKSARPRFLNLLKPIYRDPLTSLERARRHLANGHSVGTFPEGTVNRDSARLLVGRTGAARLSLEARVPVVPMGIRFPEATAERPGPMELFIGAPRRPPAATKTPAPFSAVREWHASIMTDIARLSGKEWSRRKGGGNED